MAESPFMDPRFMGLATLASGLLSAAGPRPYPVSFGQAIGQSGISALQAMQQARAQQIQLADASLKRQLLNEEINKFKSDALQRQIENQGLGIANLLVSGLNSADLRQFGGPDLSQNQGALPAGPIQNNPAPAITPIQPSVPVSPTELGQKSPQQDVYDQRGMVLQPTNVTGEYKPWDILNAQADYLETNAASTRGVAGAKRLTDMAKILRDRADRLEARYRGTKLAGFDQIASQAGLVKGTPEYAAAQKNWLAKQTQFAPPQNINMYSTSLIPAVDAKGNPVFIQPSGKEGVAPRIVSGYAPPEAASEKKARMSEQLARQNTERTIGLIDDVIHYVQSNPSTVGIFGLGKGLYESAAGQLNANQPQTVAALQTKIRLLQSAIWRDLVGGGQLSRTDYEQIDNIIRGRAPLDTVNSVVDAMNQVKSYIQNKANVQPEYTQEDLEYTAKKYGISVDEVKKRLRGR